MNIFDVARYILGSVGGEISAMKLQKLCYYSQAWNLAWDDKELFPEDFLRWDYGLICKELFDIHQGMFFVNKDIISENLLSGNPNDRESRNIDQILEEYGKHSGCELSEMTREEDPWKKTASNSIISKQLMHEYYLGLIKEKKVTCSEFMNN